MTITTSDAVRPPAHPFYGDSYERGLDPWHVDAAPKEFGLDQDPAWNRGERKGGWFLLDAWGQEIGFIPDGTVFEIAGQNDGRAQ
jgi:hypothetical protein